MSGRAKRGDIHSLGFNQENMEKALMAFGTAYLPPAMISTEIWDRTALSSMKTALSR